MGLVLGLEMSRLARRSLGLASADRVVLAGRALLADADGLYDPNRFNDPLLLGLKGTMSEVELHLIGQQMA